EYDLGTDVVVVGSGAAGLSAAIAAADGGADVVMIEKTDMIGGTTGVSGGMPWIPMNRHMSDLEMADSREEALGYIRRLTLGREPDPAVLETYVDSAPEVMEYLETKTPLRMSVPAGFGDYYGDLPGAKSLGRSLEPVPFDVRASLPDWASRLRTSPYLPWLTMAEGAKFLTGKQPPDPAVEAERRTSDTRVLGAALVAALFKGILDRDVEVLTHTAVDELLMEDDTVVGVRARTPDTTRYISARRGVVLACGGFEWDEQMVRCFTGLKLHPMSPSGNEGDGHRMAMRGGAELANMGSFWGQPAIFEPGFEYEGRGAPQMGTFRSTPGVIVVNRHGKRFTNEGVTYQDFCKGFGIYDPVAIDYPNDPPVWMIFDQKVKDWAVILPTVLPGQDAPEWILRGDTVGDLAQRLGIDPDALELTVRRWNEQVAELDDREFHRGTVWFETFMCGPPSARKCLAPVSSPPFYAIELHLATLGTNGGPRTDADGRVRRHGGGVVEGLYAAGNTAACVFGPAYPGGGATLGPALVFGFLAGRHAATRSAPRG
ncbi:MAG TPA: FAD-dependent oxidoreductase, partial [Acidimicrobiales bacterium]|nr:FAD-dependent oxidoreductase [Acidimicrobiales bacterium]